MFDSKFLLAIVAVNRNSAEVAHCHNELALRYDYQNNRSLALAHLRSAASGGHEIAQETIPLVSGTPEVLKQACPDRRHSI